MVVGSSAYYLDGGNTQEMMMPAGSAAHNKCRYKTGKCTNPRSSKRNGQAHMLCLHHRDKANKIQRKFDRQKRQSARMTKSSSSSSPSCHNRSSAGSRSSMMMAGGAASVFAQSMVTSAPAGPSSSFTGLLNHEVDIYSDSDSSRFSTDSESSVASQLDQVWRDMPSLSPLAALGVPSPIGLHELPSPVSTRGCVSSSSHGQLSHDEIDFLYAAMLE